VAAAPTEPGYPDAAVELVLPRTGRDAVQDSRGFEIAIAPNYRLFCIDSILYDYIIPL